MDIREGLFDFLDKAKQGIEEQLQNSTYDNELKKDIEFLGRFRRLMSMADTQLEELPKFTKKEKSWRKRMKRQRFTK